MRSCGVACGEAPEIPASLWRQPPDTFPEKAGRRGQWKAKHPKVGDKTSNFLDLYLYYFVCVFLFVFVIVIVIVVVVDVDIRY